MKYACCISLAARAGNIMLDKTITILYFASLREQLGVGEETFVLDAEGATVGNIRQRLAERGAGWRERFAPGSALLSAINHTMVKDDINLSAGDELAFFPPVTGG